MIHHQAIEERDVAIVQADEIRVLIERRGTRAYAGEEALELFVLRHDAGRQQPTQTKR